jgi:BCD family chlorophyll transporter-like MFS transporter
VAAGICALAVLITTFAVAGIERQPAKTASAEGQAAPVAQQVGFRQALNQVWREPAARRFTVFVFVSMLAYSAKDLILEPFAGSVFGYTPGSSTQLSGVQHGGVLLGMLTVAAAGLVSARWKHRPWAGQEPEYQWRRTAHPAQPSVRAPALGRPPRDHATVGSQRPP